MIDADRLRTCVSASFRQDEAGGAHELSEAGHTRGEIVLRISQAEEMQEYGLRRALEDILVQEEEHKRDLLMAIEKE